MTTWKLWRALQTPPIKHPLFDRVTGKQAIRLSRYISMMGPVGITLLIVIFAVGIWHAPTIILPTLFNPSVALPLLFLLFTGTIYGLVWAASISQIITRMRLQGKYDLLRLSQPSALVINWVICTGYLYRNHSFTRISEQRAWITRLLLMIPVAMILPVLIGFIAAEQQTGLMLLSTFIHVLALAAAFYVDHVQSAVLGSLIGMHVPNHSRSESDSAVLAGLLFLTLQTLGYGIAWMLGFVLLPQMYIMTQADGLFIEFSLPLIRLLMFYMTREIFINLLWLRLTRQLEANPAELDLLSP